MAVPVTLKVYKGDQLVASRDYNRDMIKIGRLASAHLCLDDDKVSRIHSVIEVSNDGSLSIIDMGSVEGTWVNGKRVNKGSIAFGDEIRVGNTTIRVNATEAAAANLAQAAATNGADELDSPTQVGNVAESLSQAAGGSGDNTVTNVRYTPPAEPDQVPRETVVVRQPPPPPADAMDSSFASTQQNAALAPASPDTERVARPRPQRRKGSGPLGLELRFMWGDQMVGEFFLHPGKPASFSVGSAAGVNFVMGDSKLGAPKFDVVTADAQGFHVHFTGKMKGELTRRGETMDLKQVIESGKANHDGGAYSLALEADDFVRVDLGAVDLELFFQPVPKPVLVPFTDSMDFTVVNIFLVMFFLAALFVITAMNRDAEGDEFADELNASQARIAKLIVKPPEAEKNPLLEKLAQQKAQRESGEMAAKHRGDEGQMGKKDAKKRDAHAAPKGDPNNKDQARMLAAKIFGGGKGGISTIFGSGGLGGELRSAMGNMFGSAPGDSQGLGGLGLRGSGGGGGGVGDTIGIGAIGTKGRGGGTGAYGSGVGVLGGKKGVDIGITASEPEVMGSLDKELIRQVIHRNRNQIRYCYESQLTRYPKLNGKVAIKFVISGAGSVASSSVAQSTAGNAELETCVAGRVRTWVFPKPKGGGIVVVTYPFIFKQSGE